MCFILWELVRTYFSTGTSGENNQSTIDIEIVRTAAFSGLSDKKVSAVRICLFVLLYFYLSERKKLQKERKKLQKGRNICRKKEINCRKKKISERKKFQ